MNQFKESMTDAEGATGGIRARQLFVGLVLPAVCLAGLVLPLALWGAELPDRVASHFGASGAPDDSMTPGTLALVIGMTLVAPGVVTLVVAVALSGSMPRPGPPFVAGLGAFLAMLGSAIMTWTVLTQRGLADWTEASDPGWGLVAVLAASVGAGILAAVVAMGLPYDRSSALFSAQPGAEVPVMEMVEGERAVFTELISPAWMLWLTGGILALTVTLAVFSAWWIAIILALTAVPMLLLSALRVQVDHNGLIVRSALFGVRFARVKVADIEQASVIEVEPLKWGGWGYRGSLRLAGTAAVVMRRGPGVHLRLSGDRVFVVTLDNPQAAAAILNANLV